MRQQTGPGVFDINGQLAAAQEEANRTQKPVAFMVSKMQITVNPVTTPGAAAPKP